MNDTTAAPAAIPALPNASIDMNQLFANDAAGMTGQDVFDGAMLLEAVAEPSTPDPDAPREPRVGDEVVRDETGGGWSTITAPWLDEPIKVQGDAAAAARVDELVALIPTQAI